MARKGKKAPPGDGGAGAPAWVMTFADLMSLLMCFFVLLLSFSEMDAAKYKQVSGSMKFAFGVQRDVKVQESPKGVTMIAKEFSPGKPQPTLEKVLRQQTTDETREYIEVLKAAEKGLNGAREGEGSGGTDGEDGKDGKGKGKGGGAGEAGKDGEPADADKMNATKIAAAQVAKLRVALRDEIQDGLLDIKMLDDGVLVKVREQGAFPSGRAELNGTFMPVLDKIAGALLSEQSRLVVSGHTDDIPIATGRYPSNWMLSAARATSVVDGFVKRGLVKENRMEVRAHADTQPIASNRDATGRAKNRRVEIFIAMPPELSPGGESPGPSARPSEVYT